MVWYRAREPQLIWFVFYVSLPNEIKLLLFNIFFFDINPWLFSMDRRCLRRRMRMKQKERKRNQGIFTDSPWSTRSKKFVDNFRLNMILFSHLTNLSGSGCMWSLCWGHLYFNRYGIRIYSHRDRSGFISKIINY